jgi:hypothetical protein
VGGLYLDEVRIEDGLGLRVCSGQGVAFSHAFVLEQEVAARGGVKSEGRFEQV